MTWAGWTAPLPTSFHRPASGDGSRLPTELHHDNGDNMKFQSSLKATAASLAAGVFLLAGSGPARAEGKVVLYCPAPGEWCQNVANDFKRSTGIDVDVLRRSAGEILAQLRAES